MGINLSISPPCFQLNGALCIGMEHRYVADFQEMGLQPELVETFSRDIHNAYSISFHTELEVFRAGIVVLKHYVYENDQDFVNYADKVLFLYYSQTEKKNLSEADEKNFCDILFGKYTTLFNIHTALQELASLLKLDCKLIKLENLQNSSSCKLLVEQIKIIAKANRDLYGAIVDEARNQTHPYNHTAMQMYAMSYYYKYLKENHPTLMERAEAASQDRHLPPKRELDDKYLEEQKTTTITHTLPYPATVYPYQEPDIEFPGLATKAHTEHILSVSAANFTPNLSVSTANVKDLYARVSLLLSNQQNCNSDLLMYKNFFAALRNFSSDIYGQILNALNVSGLSTEFISRILERSNNIQQTASGANQITIPEIAHRYNSRPSPLIAVIHDESLSKDEKLGLLRLLATARPYWLANERQTNLTNLEVLGGEPQTANSKFLSGFRKRTPLQHAVEYGNLNEAAELIRQGASLEARGDRYPHDQCTALHVAVLIDDYDKVKLLLEAGANARATDKRGITPLHLAKDVKIAELLIQHGAEINCKDKKSNTALHSAVRSNFASVVVYLLKQEGIEVNAENDTRSTPLHFASHYGVSRDEWFSSSVMSEQDVIKATNNLKVMMSLIGSGADVNRTNQYGYTALHLAVNMGQDCFGKESGTNKIDLNFMLTKVRILCTNRANTNTTSEPRSTEYYGKEYHYNPTPDSTPLLSLYNNNYNAIVWSIMPDEVFAQRQAVAEVLIKNGAIHTKLCEKNYSLLHECARVGDHLGLEYFLKMNLDANHQSTPTSATPIEEVLRWRGNRYLSQDRWKPCIDILLQHGADLNRTSIQTVTVSGETLNPKQRGVYLPDVAVKAIFENDNVITKKAREQGICFLVKSHTHITQRSLLREIWQALGSAPIELEIPMLPEIASRFYSGYNTTDGPCNEAVQHVKACRERAKWQSFWKSASSLITSFSNVICLPSCSTADVDVSEDTDSTLDSDSRQALAPVPHLP